MQCSACGFDNPTGFRFCGGCGRRLPARTTEAEHRQLTVLFCDLVGSTELSRRLDPEDYRELLRAYREQCAEVIHRFAGQVVQCVGDGLLVYFGYPIAHEDAAERAALAGLGLLQTVRELKPKVHSGEALRLAARVGIHTGLAVVGEMGQGDTWERMASAGETPNLAARIQQEAEPHTVLMSAATRQLLRDRLPARAVGPSKLKGFLEPVMLYELVAEAGIDRSDDDVPSQASPLIDREEELALLLDRWTQSREHRGQSLLLEGEAGIGKSRLVQALKEQVALEPHHRWEARCSPYFQHTAFYPFIELVEQALGLRHDCPADEKLRKLERAIARYAPADQLASLFATFLSLSAPGERALPFMSRERQRRAMMEGIATLALAVAADRPLLLIVEDLHWADPSTLELLGMLVDRIAAGSIFAVFSYRPDFDPPWRRDGHLKHLTLTGLPPGHAAAMAQRVAAGKELPEQIVAQVVTRTDGVPLFIEELTRMLIHSAALEEHDERYELTDPATAVSIPSTLRDLLTARLDALHDAKHVAQVAAVIGREFDYQLLAAVSSLDAADLRASLDRLLESGLVYGRGAPPDSVYRFKHHLIQEAAYNSLLRRRRQHYHHRIAALLEERFHDLPATHPELLAHHYSGAEIYETAARYWRRAGEQALERSAAIEAAVHLRRGLDLMSHLPQGTARAEAEVMLHIGLGVALTATRGYASEEVASTYASARDLCETLGETAQLFPALRGLQSFYVVRGPLDIARKLGEQLLRHAQRNGDMVQLVEAERRLGWCLFCRGELADGRRHLMIALEGYDSARSREHIITYGSDPAVVAHVNLAWLEWFAGRSQHAVAHSHTALAHARELKHPLSLAYALCMSAAMHQCCREAPATRELAGETVLLADENGFPYWKAWGMTLEGWALAEGGSHDVGFARLVEGLEAYAATGAELFRPHALSLVAEICVKTGRLSDARVHLEDALANSERNNVYFLKADLLRRKGELLSIHGDGAAESYLRDALAVAREQGAWSLELRAATVFAKLCGEERRTTARQALAEILGRFTEALDTVDLRAARATLDELR